MESIYEKLTIIFRDIFEDDTISVTPDLTASDVGEWDSLSHIRLILSVQNTFRVNFSAAEAAKMKNVGELVELIEVKMAQ